MDDTAANEYFERRVRVAPDAVALAKRMHEIADRLFPQFCDTDLPPEPWSEVEVRDKAFAVALATELLAEGLVSGPPVGYLLAGGVQDPVTHEFLPGRIANDWDMEIHPDRMTADAAYADLCERLPGTAEDPDDPREYRIYEVRPAAKVYAETAGGYAVLGPFDSAEEMFDALADEAEAGHDLSRIKSRTREPRPDPALTVGESAARPDAEYGPALRALGALDAEDHFAAVARTISRDPDPLAARGLTVVCPNCGHDTRTASHTVATCDAADGCGWSSSDGGPPSTVRPVMP